MKASYVEDDEVKTLKLPEFRRKVKAGELADDVQVFDFSKDSYLEFLNGFLLPLRESWAGFIK
ncbi:MAG: hypothetical protein EAS48_04925 [Chryseobacterium sp.]|nr:MAG: hypothetical protein EAS48_04925 [Chryseobacterium sp.]